MADDAGEASGVVSREASAFAYEAQGGFGMASGEPTPSPTEPMAVLTGDGTAIRRAWYSADRPPTGVPMDPSTSGDDFLRRLEAADG